MKKTALGEEDSASKERALHGKKCDGERRMSDGSLRDNVCANEREKRPTIFL